MTDRAKPRKGWAPNVIADEDVPSRHREIHLLVPVLAFTTETDRNEAESHIDAWAGVQSAPGATDMERALHAEVVRLSAIVREGGASRLAEFTAIREALEAEIDRLRTELKEARTEKKAREDDV